MSAEDTSIVFDRRDAIVWTGERLEHFENRPEMRAAFKFGLDLMLLHYAAQGSDGAVKCGRCAVPIANCAELRLALEWLDPMRLDAT